MAQVGKSIIKIPKKIKAGDVIEVRSVIMHPQVSGFGKKDKKPYHLTDIEVFYNNKLVMSWETHPSISQNPYFAFKLKVTKSGPLKMVWKDNKSDVYTKTVNIKI